MKIIKDASFCYVVPPCFARTSQFRPQWVRI